VLVPKEQLSPNVSYGPHASLAQNGRTVAASIGTTGGDSLVHVWDLTNGQEKKPRLDKSHAHFAGFSPDARVMASFVNVVGPATPSKGPKMKAQSTEIVGTQVVLQEVATGRSRLVITLPEPYSSHPAFAFGDHTLMTYGFNVRTDAAGSHWFDHTLRLWELATGQERLAIRSPKEGRLAGYQKIAFSPDGRTLAAARLDQTLEVWDLATGAALLNLTGFETDIYCLAFRPDGKALASGHRDSTILIWDLTTGAAKLRPIAPLTPQQLDQAWADLDSADARKAYAAILRMTAAPERTVPLLGACLSPVPSPPAETLRKLLADLESDRFQVRQAASGQLAGLGELAESALEEAMKGDLSAEKRRRIELLLGTPRVARTPEQIRALRAIEVLDRIGNAEAQRVLETIAGGAPEARLTRDARTALERLLHRR
jgi:hypothetical protein